MTHSYGLRSHTRKKFSKPFRGRGVTRISKFLTTYKRGDFVDIIVDGAQHKGMPFHLYHGRTARVFNVNPRSVGIALKKQVGNRQVLKRLHVRVEHIRKSNCRQKFIERVQKNDELKKEAKAKGQKAVTKRLPAQPRGAEYVKPTQVEFQHPEKFVIIV